MGKEEITNSSLFQEELYKLDISVNSFHLPPSSKKEELKEKPWSLSISLE